MIEKKTQSKAETESKRNQDWEIRKQGKNGAGVGEWGRRMGSPDWEWVACRVSEWERMKDRAENEYSKHCFNLKQIRFQENEFQWIWAKNNYRDFLVLFCEWRASLFSRYLRGRNDQSQEIEGMPLCPFTLHTAQEQTFLSFLFQKLLASTSARERKVAAAFKPSWIFYFNNRLFTLIKLSINIGSKIGGDMYLKFWK